MIDGVHVLLMDRSEIGKFFVRDIPNSRNDNNYVYSEYTPTHLHHNWRFNNVYGDKKDKSVE